MSDKHLSDKHFTLTDLMTLLSSTTGLPAAARTDDGSLGFEDVDLDSLAFLQLQSALQDTYGFELPERDYRTWTFEAIAELIDRRISTGLAA